MRRSDRSGEPEEEEGKSRYARGLEEADPRRGEALGQEAEEKEGGREGESQQGLQGEAPSSGPTVSGTK